MLTLYVTKLIKHKHKSEFVQRHGVGVEVETWKL